VASATRELLAERYHLEQRIATGGMGVVWRARDHRLGRDVAIKLIRPEYADDPTFRQRLRLEARAIAAIRSPHVVRIHDVCEEPDPAGGVRSFLVMELVDGRPLSAVLRDGPLTIERTADAMGQAASALATAHEQQIIHRDVKPGNLMLDPSGRVTVLDFGIARAADAVALTATDLILGTARYIAPEQADGRGASAASDVYSLGVVAFECLTGNVPYDAGSDVAIALAHLRDPIPELPAAVPQPVASLVRDMLAKDPQDRPSARDVADRFAALPAATAATTVTIPEAGPAAPEQTAVMPMVMAAHQRVRDRLAGRDLRDTRSAAVRPRALFLPAAVTVLGLLLGSVLAGGSDTLRPSAAAGATPQATQHEKAPKVAKVRIDPTLYIGQPWPAVRDTLTALGVTPVPQFAGSGSGGTVVGLAPTGKVKKGSAVTVVVARPEPVKPKPEPKEKHEPKPKPPGHHGHLPPGQAKKHDH
jgi:serine/threonine-protein kinase